MRYEEAYRERPGPKRIGSGHHAAQASLIGTMRGELALALARTLLARSIAALGSLALSVILARTYGTAGVGTFALAQALVTGAAMIAKYGMDFTLTLYIGREAGAPGALTYLRWACAKSAIIACALAVALALSASPLEVWFATPGLAAVLMGAALALPAITLALLLSGLMRGLHRPAVASLLENGAISLVAAGLLVALQRSHPQAGLANAGWALGVGAWLVMLLGAAQALRWCRQTAPTSSVSPDRADFDRSSADFLVMSLSGFMQASLGMVIAGSFLRASELGLLKAAQQLSVLVSFILVVINAVFPPRFAALYHQGRLAELDRLARQSSLLGVVMALPLLASFLLVPRMALAVFGEQFSGAAVALQIIALGQMVNVATGSVGWLLIMTGHEALMRNVSLVTNAVGLVLFFALIPPLGVLGGALATAFTLVAQNLAAAWYAWRRLNIRIWAIPFPNAQWLAPLRQVLAATKNFDG